MNDESTLKSLAMKTTAGKKAQPFPSPTREGNAMRLVQQW